MLKLQGIKNVFEGYAKDHLIRYDHVYNAAYLDFCGQFGTCQETVDTCLRRAADRCVLAMTFYTARVAGDTSVIVETDILTTLGVMFHQAGFKSKTLARSMSESMLFVMYRLEKSIQ